MPTKKNAAAPPPAEDRYLSAEDAHKSCGLSARYLKAELRAGRLKGKNFKGRRGWMILQSSLNEYIAAGNADAVAAAKAETKKRAKTEPTTTDAAAAAGGAA